MNSYIIDYIAANINETPTEVPTTRNKSITGSKHLKKEKQ